MARPEYRNNHSIENLVRLVSSPTSEIGQLLIVNKTILTSLLALIPQDKISSFLENTSPELPKLGDPVLAIWLKNKRASLRLTQKQLASRLQKLDLKIHPSDIGNLETNRRKELYTPERVSRIVQTINTLLPL